MPIISHCFQWAVFNLLKCRSEITWSASPKEPLPSEFCNRILPISCYLRMLLLCIFHARGRWNGNMYFLSVHLTWHGSFLFLHDTAVLTLISNQTEVVCYVGWTGFHTCSLLGRKKSGFCYFQATSILYFSYPRRPLVLNDWLWRGLPKTTQMCRVFPKGFTEHEFLGLAEDTQRHTKWKWDADSEKGGKAGGEQAHKKIKGETNKLTANW